MKTKPTLSAKWSVFQSTILFAGFITVGLVVFGFIELVLTDHDQPLQHAVALTAVMGACGLPILMQRSLWNNPFHVFSYYLIQAFIGFVIGAIVFHYGLIDVDVPEEVFLKTTLVASGSLLLLYIGYRIPIGRSVANWFPLVLFTNDSTARPDGGWRPYLISLVGLYAAGWSARMIGAALGYFHSAQGQTIAFLPFNFVWTAMPVFSTLSLMIILGIWLDDGVSLDLPSIIPLTLIAMEVFAGFINGSRSQMIMPILLLLVVYNYVRQTVSWKSLLVGFLTVVFLFLPLATLYRSVYKSNIASGRKVSVDTAVDSASNISGQQEDFRHAYGRSIERITVDFQALARVFARVPDRYDFQQGDTFVEGMYMSFIPRIVYPEKGFYNPTRRYAVLFFDSWEEGSTNTSITIPGELYFNYGYAGLLGLLFLGAVFRFFWERFRMQTRAEFMPLYRVHYLLFVVLGITSLATYPAGLVRTGLIYYIGFIILHRRIPSIVMPSKLNDGGS